MTKGAMIFFLIFSCLTLLFSLGVAFFKHALYCALSLVMTVISLACLYICLQEEFLAMLTILLYTGGIIVLFMFVIMMIHIKNENASYDVCYIKKSLGIGLSLVVLLSCLIFPSIPFQKKHLFSFSIQSLSRIFYQNEIFLLISILLLLVMVGGLLLSQNELEFFKKKKKIYIRPIELKKVDKRQGVSLKD